MNITSLELYKPTNISMKKQNILNEIINLIGSDNIEMNYTYQIRAGHEYILYQCFRQATKWDIERLGIRENELIYFDIYYDTLADILRIDISVRDKKRKLIAMNTATWELDGLKLSTILQFANGALRSLKMTRDYGVCKVKAQ